MREYLKEKKKDKDFYVHSSNFSFVMDEYFVEPCIYMTLVKSGYLRHHDNTTG
ncbi:hypothetical protein B7P43_G14805 [Cryptotermes secundus]|uniref:Uncharacterized protein n=1 Tax=Cryptotermes secundus TaxID=105785 RepID=A0A2J7QEB8_9NEOP|nr:hypothetical protein B7P43_G14805 [Cryptotermes secundus]